MATRVSTPEVAAGYGAGQNGAGDTARRPEPLSTNGARVIAGDVIQEPRTWRSSFPPGPRDFDFARTKRMSHDPLPILLSLYEQHGPIFSIRILHRRMVWMLGPEANNFITVSHPENFHWREGSFGDLTPLLGDGLLTIDGAYHDRARRMMMPAFHREQIIAAVETMAAEADAAISRLEPGAVVDIYEWMRNLAMRIAMRSLFGLDPDDDGHGAAAAEHFERALSFYGIEFHLRLLRGPRSPWRKMLRSRAVLDEIVYAEIAERRRNPDPERRDVLSLLLASADEDGDTLADEEVRDQVMTLMFAGHDTSTSTLSFLAYELARNPRALALLQAEQDAVLGGHVFEGQTPATGGQTPPPQTPRPPTPMQLEKELPYLEMVLDEVLRLYPPAWVGPRRAVRDFDFGGYRVPAGTYVHYCSWASHRIPEVFADPEQFVPERFERSRKAALPRGAYVPFGNGSRICIGKKFGQTEVKLVATMLLQRLRFELMPGRTMTIRQMPTLSPDGGLEVRIRERELPQTLIQGG